MGREIEIRELRDGDIEHLNTYLRAADRAEITASSGPDTLATIRRSVDRSTMLAVATVDGDLACIFGLVPTSILTGTGAPWMLGTDVLDANSRSLMRMCRGYIGAMLAECPHLENAVDVRNERSVRWLKRLGFAICEVRPVGLDRMPFYRFEMRG